MARAVAGFDGDEGNSGKCQRHGLSVAEIEALFAGELAVFPDAGHSRYEQRYKAVGKTREGRYVFVVFTLRRRGGAAALSSSDPSAPGICTSERLITMKKRLPRLKSDKEAEDFVETADLAKYDLSHFRRVRFEFQPKTERVNMRVPASLLKAVKMAAARQGIAYQRFIRQVLEQAVSQRKS